MTSSHSTADASPLPARERIQALDVLRGVAVAGILLANVMVFFGLFAKVGDYRLALFYAGFLFLPSAAIAFMLPEPPDEKIV